MFGGHNDFKKKKQYILYLNVKQEQVQTHILIGQGVEINTCIKLLLDYSIFS